MEAPTKHHPLKTVITITTGFLIIYILMEWNWALIVSAVIGVIGVFSGFLVRKVDYLWMKLAWLLSLVIPNIILGIVFYFLLFPIAILARIFGKKDPLFLRNNRSSMFVEIKNIFKRESFEKPW